MSGAVDNLRELIEATEHEAECEEAKRKAGHDHDQARRRLGELSKGPVAGRSYGVGSNAPLRYVLVDGRHWRVTWTRLGDDRHRVDVEQIKVENLGGHA